MTNEPHRDAPDAGLDSRGSPTGWLTRPMVRAALILAPIGALLAGALFLLVPERVTHAETAGGVPSGFTDAQRQDIERIVKDYLIKNPEVILEIQSALQTKMAEEEAARTKELVATNAKEIYRHPSAAVAGNPDGDVTVVEFFDYNCGYCKRGFADVAKLIENDPKVRFVFKEFPILSKDSEEVSKLALAARLQGKYWEFHRALLSLKGRATEATALDLASKIGLDVERLKADRNDPSVQEELDRVQDLANKMGINGTPHFLVGNESVGGAPENLYDLLSEKVSAFRKNGCTYC